MKNTGWCIYDAFTLVEMLIVMGILIILMALGVTAGRFAINRANAIAHESAVENVYTALQAYYIDHKEFPSKSSTTGGGCIAPMILEGGALYEYIDGEINPGSDAMYYYAVTDDQQTVLVCVSLWGVGDVNVSADARLYCVGNGFGSDEISVNITSNYVDFQSDGYYDLRPVSVSCNWYDSEWQY